MRFAVGFFAPIAFEFLLLCGMLGFYCGPLYLGNMILTFALYAQYSLWFSKQRIVQIRKRRDVEKKQEFNQNETILNYETVKSFNNEKLETDRYGRVLDDVLYHANTVQTSLS